MYLGPKQKIVRIVLYPPQMRAKTTLSTILNWVELCQLTTTYGSQTLQYQTLFSIGYVVPLSPGHWVWIERLAVSVALLRNHMCKTDHVCVL